MSSFAIAITVAFLSVLFWRLTILWRKYKMTSNEQKLKEAGILPYGSGVSHGMYLSPKDNMRVAKDYKSTQAWFSRID